MFNERAPCGLWRYPELDKLHNNKTAQRLQTSNNAKVSTK